MQHDNADYLEKVKLRMFLKKLINYRYGDFFEILDRLAISSLSIKRNENGEAIVVSKTNHDSST